MLAAALAIVVTVGPALVAIPDEPGAEVVATGPVVQAVVADLNGDGAREILALVGGDGGSIRLVGWRDGADGWQPMGLPIGVAASYSKIDANTTIDLTVGFDTGDSRLRVGIGIVYQFGQ